MTDGNKPWPPEWSSLSVDGVMRQLRQRRGVAPDTLDGWRTISTDPDYLSAQLSSVFSYCRDQDIDPRHLDGCAVAELLSSLAPGMAASLKLITGVNTVRFHGMNMQRLNDDPDVEVAKNVARRRADALAVHAAPAGTVATDEAGVDSDEYQKVPPRGLKVVFDFYRGKIIASGGIEHLPCKHLFEFGNFVMMTDARLRGTGRENLPGYRPRRYPPSASLQTAARWWLASVNTKEMKLAKVTGWCKGILITQNPKEVDPTQLSVIYMEMLRRVQDESMGGRKLKEHMYYGRMVLLEQLFVKRTGAESKSSYKWNFSERCISTTLQSMVRKCMEAVHLGEYYAGGPYRDCNFKPSHTRHLSATYMAHAWVNRAESHFEEDDLRLAMRHSQFTTTKDRYIQAQAHPDVVQRWELMGYEAVAALSLSELMRN